MANGLMVSPEQDKQPKEGAGYEPRLGPEPAVESSNPFASLWSNIRDVVSPPKLPPLELESKPIAVADPMRVKRDPVSTGVAVVLHVLIILLIFWITAKKIMPALGQKPVVANVDLTAPPPIKAPMAAKAMGGGGGAHDIAPVTKGRIPPIAQQPIVPPTKPPVIPPKLAVQPSINLQPNLKMQNNTLPNFGDPRAPSVGVASMGNGSGGGIGGGSGNGLGPGSGGNTGGGTYHVGGGVSAPQVIHAEDPEFSEEARKAKFQGTVLVSLIVDVSGNPQNVHVVRGVGMGLDEKAVEAARLYRFRPAQLAGKPVPVEINMEVAFQIF